MKTIILFITLLSLNLNSAILTENIHLISPGLSEKINKDKVYNYNKVKSLCGEKMGFSKNDFNALQSANKTAKGNICILNFNIEKHPTLTVSTSYKENQSHAQIKRSEYYLLHNPNAKSKLSCNLINVEVGSSTFSKGTPLDYINGKYFWDRIITNRFIKGLNKISESHSRHYWNEFIDSPRFCYN